MKKIIMAMVQMKNYYDNHEKGKEKMEEYIEKAANEGADIIAFPELSLCGYIPNKTIWNHAQSLYDEDVKWIRMLAKKYHIYIGAGFIELKNNDFYNTYFIMNPKGELDGVIRKENGEADTFKHKEGSLYIDTSFGRIGLGICADNHFANRLERMKKVNVDIMLMPHAMPTPYRKSHSISEADLIRFKRQPYAVASTYAQYLNVTTVFINAVGDYPKFHGKIGTKSFNNDFALLGGSLVVDEKGKVLLEMNDQEDFQLIKICIEKKKPNNYKPKVYNGQWLHPGNALFRRIIFPIAVKQGIHTYEKTHMDGVNKLNEKR